MCKQSIKVWLGLSIAALMSACSTTARYVTAEHWQSDDTFFVAYTEYEETNMVIAKTGESSAHVLLCRADTENKVQCRPQVAVDRLLNPDETYPDPPAAPAAPAPAPSEADEPAPAAAPGDGVPAA